MDDENFDFFDEFFEGLNPEDEHSDEVTDEILEDYVRFLSENIKNIVGLEEIKNEYVSKITFYIKYPMDKNDDNEDNGNDDDDGGGGDDNIPKRPISPTTIELEA